MLLGAVLTAILIKPGSAIRPAKMENY